MKTIYHLAISRLKYNKGRSILTIVAIALMTTLLMSIVALHLRLFDISS